MVGELWPYGYIVLQKIQTVFSVKNICSEQEL